MKTTLLTLAILILSTLLFAQRAQLLGMVQEHPGNSPLPSVTVTLKDASAKLIAAAITNDQGIYQLDGIPTGSFVLTYSFTGFETFTKAIEITSSKSINLNAVALKPDARLLSEVTVIGERAALSLKPGKKVFEVGKDIVGQAGSITDLLNVVPSVSVSPGGGISLRGNSSVLVLIDGRRSGLTQSNALEQIPADRVERVEIISNPSSKYDASGSAGIINIILKKDKKSGFSGQLRAVAGSPNDTRLNSSLNYKSDNLDLFATYGIRKTDYVGLYRLQQRFNPLEAGELNRRQDEQRHDDGKLLYFGIDYQVNAKNTVTAAFLRNATDDHDKTQLRYLYSNKDGAIDSSLNRNGESWEQRNYNQVEFNYTRNFNTSGKKLTVDMQYDFWNSNKDWNLSTERNLPTNILLPIVRTGARGATKDLIVQTDLTLPIDSNAGFAFGLKMDNRSVRSHFIAEQEQGGLWDIIDQIDNRLIYKELIGTAYIEFSSKSGRLSYQAGLRNELTQIGIEESGGEYASTKNYNRLFPTLSLNYNFSKGVTLQGSYSKRINRPSLNLIYPFNELTDLTTRFMGNPDLNPSYADVFELSFLQNWNSFTFNPSVYFQNNRDVIKEYTYRNSDNLFITLPVNIDHETRQGIELLLQYKPVKWLQMATEINAYRYSQRGIYHGQDFTYTDNTITGRMNTQVKLKNKLAFQAIYNFIGVNATAQTRNTAIHSIDVGASKTFLKDRITLLFDASNIFELRKFESRTIGADYVIRQSNIPNATRYRMTLIYKLNLKNNQSVRQAKSGNRG
ncbi:TonB-dependent receptor domain-containing protein [Pedobacter insulae]|uniref:Outer membrane receptor proteins, mostly Fe transport n=1 Tax=Pedobacter insulae TaxID=414048 RepID=A0A1I2WRL9_9SPHI|nr:TonB-dependent receptor [Pedobacter insulae]SFH04028.1 Outer membrane receptor proteins, mostly Fe transport [Pedobacter insulae]